MGDTATAGPGPLLLIKLALPGIPAKCPDCGEQPQAWPLVPHNHQILVTCPECWTPVAPVVAVAAG